MRLTPDFDLPPEKEHDFRHARRLEWITIAYIVSSATFLGFTMGSSQVMRTSFFEDVISLVPAIAFLVCTRIARRPPSKVYPYGFHGAVSIGYLVASLALLAMGAFLLIDAVMSFVAEERTTIGGMRFFGQTIWSGWLMFAAIAYTMIPSFILGHLKLKQAPKIHDKILYADAKMMKADWMAELGTLTGVLGVSLGFWWVDPVASALISASILKDGWENIRVAISDLIERRPMKTDQSAPEPFPEELKARLEQLDWVARAEVRLRECGHLFFGEAFITPRGAVPDLPAKIRLAVDEAKAINWRLHDVTITLVDDPKHKATAGPRPPPFLVDPTDTTLPRISGC
ncbi:MAG TPA: cation diffusion facilitator family transporter [Chthoniobacteraceae bacterium]|jgi:cation diffusion facilitator family transporter